MSGSKYVSILSNLDFLKLFNEFVHKGKIWRSSLNVASFLNDSLWQIVFKKKVRSYILSMIPIEDFQFNFWFICIPVADDYLAKNTSEQTPFIQL